MTAVEFIRQEFLEKLTNENYKNSFDEIINQAKEMEKEQMINFHIGAMKKGLEYENEEEWNDGDFPLIKKTAEQYYNQTFKSE